MGYAREATFNIDNRNLDKIANLFTSLNSLNQHDKEYNVIIQCTTVHILRISVIILMIIIIIIIIFDNL